MSILTLHVNQLAEDRGKSFVNPNFAKPSPPVSLIFSDIYDTTIQFVNNTNITSSLFNLIGTTAYLSLGSPGFNALAVATCSVISPTAYSALFHLNTNNLDYDLAPDQTKQYTIELQVVSGSSIFSWQHPCTVKKDIILNQIYPLNSQIVISSSYALTAGSVLSSSHALTASYLTGNVVSASHALSADKVSFGDPNNLVNSSILVRGQGGCLISMGEQNLLNQITVAGLSIYDETLSPPDDEIIRISPVTTWFSGSSNFGIGVSSPDGDPNNKLQVAGNIICSNITASTLLGNLVSNDHNLTIDNSGLNVGSGDELVHIDSNIVNVAGVIQLSNQGLSVGFSSPDITTISNGKINALRITSSLYGTASWALNAVNAISANSTENAEFAISATNADVATLALTSNTASAVLQVNADSLIKLNVDRPNLGPTSPILLLSASNHDVGAYNADAIDISNENYTEAFHYEVDGNFYILGNAKTGLGTDSPSEKLHIVSGSILAEGNYPLLTLRNSDVSTVLTTADLTISDIALGSLAMAITAPDTYINFYDANGYIVNFSTNGHSYITNSFNFGIGTQTPTEKLEVVGNVLATAITGSIHATPQTAGTVALSGGMALVSTNAVNTNSKIFLTSQTGNAGNLWVGSRSNGVSFQITSSTSNTETVAWFIIN